MVFSVTKKETTPFDGQKPGTSGLRKKVRSPLLLILS
jgi:phosphoglucomutase